MTRQDGVGRYLLPDPGNRHDAAAPVVACILRQMLTGKVVGGGMPEIGR
jgi:hypothetical protein